MNDKLQAGRELDARIAKRMGWVGVAQRRRVGQGLSEDVLWLGLRREDADSLTEVPRYSTRIDDAWQVWVYIAQPGWLLEYDGNGAYSIYVDYRDHENATALARGETFALAVCLAALEAL